MTVASTVNVQAEYKSPLPKLVSFFKNSRDQWKQKCANLRKELKLFKNQVRAVEKSRDYWKQSAKDAAKQAALLQEQLKNFE